MDLIQEFLKACESDTEYDFIANNYYNMRKEELKDILLEYIYAVYRAENGRIENHEITSEMLDGLKDRIA